MGQIEKEVQRDGWMDGWVEVRNDLVTILYPQTLGKILEVPNYCLSPCFSLTLGTAC
jgi:hypothetical protein